MGMDYRERERDRPRGREVGVEREQQSDKMV